MDVPKVSPAEVRRDMESGKEVWLVCAYDDDARSEQFRLKGALNLREFERHALVLPSEARIVFYCG